MSTYQFSVTMTADETVTVTNVKRHAGIAGQYEISADITYPGEPTERISFVGSTYGGPIVMVTPRHQVFVSQSVTDRLGSKLDETWVCRFFGATS